MADDRTPLWLNHSGTKPFPWTDGLDATIRDMRAAGATWEAIGVVVGCARYTVTARAKLIGAHTPARVLEPDLAAIAPAQPERTAEPLAAFHPIAAAELERAKGIVL